MSKNGKRLDTEKQKMKKGFQEKKWSSGLVFLEDWAGEKTRNLKGNVS